MRFSIITPCYNSVKLIDRTMNSLANQKFKDFEVLLIEDGSDKPVRSNILQEYGLKGRYVYKTENSTGGGARNVGLQLAKGEYVLFLASDDELYDKNTLQTWNDFLTGQDVVTSYLLECGTGYTTKRDTRGMVSDAGTAYKREAIKGIPFPELPQMQDIGFNTLVFSTTTDVHKMEAVTYRYNVFAEERKDRRDYKLSAVSIVPKCNQFVFEYLYKHGKVNEAYTKSCKMLSYMFYYYYGFKDRMTDEDTKEFWDAIRAWEKCTCTIRTIRTNSEFKVWFEKCMLPNKTSAEGYTKYKGEYPPIEEFMDLI